MVAGRGVFWILVGQLGVGFGVGVLQRVCFHSKVFPFFSKRICIDFMLSQNYKVSSMFDSHLLCFIGLGRPCFYQRIPPVDSCCMIQFCMLGL
jgi:hypothetical protein